jgi:hypothetical protein
MPLVEHKYIIKLIILFTMFMFLRCRCQWPRGLRRESTAARLLRLWVWIPPESWMPVCCECCVLSGRGLCDVLTTRPEESHRLWCVVVCDLETSRMRRPWPALVRNAKGGKKVLTLFLHKTNPLKPKDYFMYQNVYHLSRQATCV